MHISLAAWLPHYLFCFLRQHNNDPLSTTFDEYSPTTLTFRPIHAHSHTFFNSTTRPEVLFQDVINDTHFDNASRDTELKIEADEVYLLDHPSQVIASSPLTIRTKPITIRRPRIRPPSMLSWALAARNRDRHQRNIIGKTSKLWIAPDYTDERGDWEDVEVLGPDVTDRQTLISLAKMSSNAYVTPDGGEWWPLDGWNSSLPFGWEPDADGLRGHVV